MFSCTGSPSSGGGRAGRARRGRRRPHCRPRGPGGARRVWAARRTGEMGRPGRTFVAPAGASRYDEADGHLPGPTGTPGGRFMALPPQTVALLKAARQLVLHLPADAVLLLTEKDLDWAAVLEHLRGCRLLVAAQDGPLTRQLKEHPELTVLYIDPGPTPTQERMSLALIEAVRSEQLHTG